MKFAFLKRIFLFAVISLFLTGLSHAKDYMRVYYVLMANSTLGDCIFIELPNGDNVLIDGGNIETKDHSDLFLDDFLDAMIGPGGTVNHMILTHSDSDHSRGLRMVMNNYTVENFYSTGQKEISDTTGMNGYIQPGCNIYKMSDFAGNAHDIYLSGPLANHGPGWDPKVRVRVLSADDSKTADSEKNERSLVIKLSLGESTFYFGGDAEGPQEDAIRVNTPNENPIDCFKIEHHGSSTYNSNNSAFLNWLQPKYAFIPTGGHTVSNGPPADVVLERLMGIGCVLYRTDLDGTILVKADNEGNYDIVRMNAFEYLDPEAIYKNLSWYDAVIPAPKAFPGHVNAEFSLGSAASRTYILPPPAIPENLLVQQIAGDNITIDWDYDPSLSIAGYYLFHSTYPGGDPGANNGWINAGMNEQTGIYKRHDTLITSAPFTFSAAGMGLSQPSYLRLSVITTYYYERRYSNEVYTTWPPTTITNLTGFWQAASGGDVELSWTAPAKYDNGSSTSSCKRYYVYFSTDAAMDVHRWNRVDSASKYGIDFSTVQPKNPGEDEIFVLKNVPAPGNDALTYFAVFSRNDDGVLSHASNITTFTVTDAVAPSPVTDLSYALYRDDSRIYVSWTASGDNDYEGLADYCEVIFSKDASFAGASTRTISSPVSPGAKQVYMVTGLDSYERYFFNVRTYDEAGNFSTSNVLARYSGSSFLNNPSFADSVSVSTSPSLELSFKIEIDTISAGSPADYVELWDTRNNLGAESLTKLSTGYYQVTVSTDSRAFIVSPALDFNHRYRLLVSSSLKDIDGEMLSASATSFYFVTLCSPSEDNIFFASDASSVTVVAGSFSQPAALFFDLSPLSDSEVNVAYNALIATYTPIGSVRGFSVSPGTVSAKIPVSGGIPYVYNSEKMVFEKATSYISSGEVVFDAQSPAVWLFVTQASFRAKKAAGVYAYPVPSTGNSITFTNLGSSAEISVFTISGKIVMRENVTPDPVNGEWVWNFDRIAPGLYFWVVDGSSRGMLMIKR